MGNLLRPNDRGLRVAEQQLNNRILNLKNEEMMTVKDYTPTRREYFKVRILDKGTNKEITIVKIGKNDSLSEAIRNIAGNMGYLRNQITYEFM